MSQKGTAEPTGAITVRADHRQDSIREDCQKQARASSISAAAEMPSTVPVALAPDALPNEGSSVRRAPRKRHLTLRMILMAGGILVVVVGSGVAWLRGGRYASTDDAYVQAAKLSVTTDVSGIVSSVNVREGQLVKADDLLFQIDPRQFQIALNSASSNLAETALTIESMKANYKALLNNLAAQEAQVSLDELTFARVSVLAHDGAVAKADYDAARFALEGDKSKLESLKNQAAEQLATLVGNADIPVTEHPLYMQAKAQVDEAQRQLDHTFVRAPWLGRVGAG